MDNELERLRAEVDALEADAAADQAEADAAAELRRLKDRKTWLELRKTHAAKRPLPLWHESGLVVLVPPSRPSYELWRKSQSLTDDGTGRTDVAEEKIQAAMALARQAVVHPDKAELRRRGELFPGLMDHIFKATVFACEGRIEELGK